MPTPADQLAVSTVWASARAEEAAWLLDRMAESGLHRLELEYRLTPALLTGVRKELRPRGLSVSSVHNYCPVPAEMPRAKASGDLFNLADLDQEARLLALRGTVSTMELAADLEAAAVVLHLGYVEDVGDKHVTREAARQGGMTPDLARLLKARAQAAPRHMDALCFSLERLSERALRLGVRLGLENRFHAHQMPDFAEVAWLLERFAGAPLGYWHDTGHAHVSALAGLTPQEEWLTAYGHVLLGCHLHDAKGDDDHRPPGDGDMDWAALCPLLLPAQIKVLEVAPGPEPQELAQAVEFLRGEFARAAAQAQERQRRKREANK